MNPEIMEELDFSPLQAIIDDQADTISELSNQVNELTDKINDLLVEKISLERDLYDLKITLENINSQIEKALR
jgi:predicted  nucleic acid-binding Zn-ribbon protein